VRVNDGANTILIDDIDLAGAPSQIEASLDGLASRIRELAFDGPTSQGTI
jgi:hypothetical protein